MLAGSAQDVLQRAREAGDDVHAVEHIRLADHADVVPGFACPLKDVLG